MEEYPEMYLIGEVRLSEKGKERYKYTDGPPLEFLMELQTLMDAHGVVKLDISIDPDKYKK